MISDFLFANQTFIINSDQKCVALSKGNEIMSSGERNYSLIQSESEHPLLPHILLLLRNYT